MSYLDLTNERILAAPKKLVPIPLIAKDQEKTAAAACVEAILTYYEYDIDKNSAEWKNFLAATEQDGTSIRKVLGYLGRVATENKKSGQILSLHLNRYMTICDLIASIDEGIPTICLIQAWHEDELGKITPTYNYRDEKKCGHYVVAVGYDRDCIYFMDPNQTATYSYIPIRGFDERWHGVQNGEDFIRAGILVKQNKVDCKAGYVYKIM